MSRGFWWGSHVTSARFSAARLIIENKPLGTMRDIEYKYFARPIRSSFLLCTSALDNGCANRFRPDFRPAIVSGQFSVDNLREDLEHMDRVTASLPTH